MTNDPDEALETLMRLVQVVGREQELRDWFCNLARQTAVERRNGIYAMAERMRTQGADAELCAAFRALADTRVFDATQLALQECGYTDK